MSCVAVGQGQLAAKRKKKFTGGNASKRHRDRVNVEFNNLAKLLPYPEAMISKLDKSSILRLAVSYIRAKSFFKDNVSSEGEEPPAEPSAKKRKKVDVPIPGRPMADAGSSMAEIFLQALEGFLLVITEDLKVLYVSESVRDYLGYCQAGIIHESILNFVHGSDEGIVRHALQFLEPQHTDSDKQETGDLDNDAVPSSSSDASSLSSMEYAESPESSLVQSRKFVCRMKCAFSCSSRFFTAFNSFQFSGHLRKSYVQEGKVKKSLNTLIVFCSPMNGAKYDSLDVIEPGLAQSTPDDKSQWPTSDDEVHDGSKPKLTGLPIEPKFRLHVAPIVMSSRDLEHCSTTKPRNGSSVAKGRRNASVNATSKSHSYNDTEQRMHHRLSSGKPWLGEPAADELRYPFHRMPRALSSDCIHPGHVTSDSPHKAAQGGAGPRDFAPEVFTSAKILLDLSQHCAARKEYDIAHNAGGRGTCHRGGSVKSEGWSDDRNHRHGGCTDDALLETHNRIYHIPRDRSQQFPYANGCEVQYDADLNSSSPHSRSPLAKTDRAGGKRAFNISSILGLDENRNGAREHYQHPARDLRCPNGNILHFPRRKEATRPAADNNERKQSPSSMEDMKSSFANILQGMASNIADRFNTAITKAIEKTNDRLSPEVE